MDEEKLKEDDWIKEVSRSIGEQIEPENNQESPEKTSASADISVSETESKSENDEININNKDSELVEQMTKKTPKKSEVPIIDKDTIVENATDNEVREEENKVTEEMQGDEEKKDDIPEIHFDEKELLGETPDALENYLEDMQKEDSKKNKWSWRKKLLLGFGILGILISIVCLFLYFFVLGRIQTEKPEDVVKLPTDLTPSELVEQEKNLKPNDFNNDIEQKVVNVLLVGEEAIKDTGRGRTDSMMIATLNTVEKSIKLTSLMRDMYVTIPGYRNNKLNAAYNLGGAWLVAETIEQNFGIQIDGYVYVNFNSFEKIVDKLGGVEITLSKDEAYYLNTTNYISKKSNRNVHEGKQVLNGNQALGYCRVRYEGATNGEHDDFGRTYRQRTVLKAIFDKYKHQNVVNMVSIATDVLGEVKTSISRNDILSYLTTALSFGTTELETSRIPLDNSYWNETIKPGPGAVLQVDFDANKKALREFMYAGIADSEIDEFSENAEEQKYFTYLWTD